MIYLLSIALSLIPGFAWLFFYLNEETRPEPGRSLARTFVYGAAFAFFTLAIQILLRNVFSHYSVEIYGLIAITVMAASEELFKFAAAYMSVRGDPAFNEPIDAMIYMTVAALGFATIENLGAIGGQPLSDPGLMSIFQTTTLRFTGATLLHTLASSLVGFYWAVSILHLKKKRFLLAGFALAIVLHALFNYFIITYGNLMYAIVFVVAAGFFVLHDFEVLRGEEVNFEDKTQ